MLEIVVSGTLVSAWPFYHFDVINAEGILTGDTLEIPSGDLVVVTGMFGAKQVSVVRQAFGTGAGSISDGDTLTLIRHQTLTINNGGGYNATDKNLTVDHTKGLRDGDMFSLPSGELLTATNSGNATVLKATRGLKGTGAVIDDNDVLTPVLPSESYVTNFDEHTNLDDWIKEIAGGVSIALGGGTNEAIRLTANPNGAQVMGVHYEALKVHEDWTHAFIKIKGNALGGGNGVGYLVSACFDAPPTGVHDRIDGPSSSFKNGYVYKRANNEFGGEVARYKEDGPGYFTQIQGKLGGSISGTSINIGILLEKNAGNITIYRLWLDQHKGTAVDSDAARHTGSFYFGAGGFPANSDKHMEIQNVTINLWGTPSYVMQIVPYGYSFNSNNVVNIDLDSLVDITGVDYNKTYNPVNKLRFSIDLGSGVKTYELPIEYTGGLFPGQKYLYRSIEDTDTVKETFFV